ncbi:hypothetical protein [uncultured Litoreibacter sp.]|uniref:hypothetical protein n=1 Tax=uncultured Litoreibacter sp. TaxID=1392394 RepID=UPI002635DDAC|nr:hypothetical protein [uncultured Litoreibacter sp.]
MSNDRTFSDEDLTAFLDGELTDADTAAIAEAIERDAALALRLEALDAPVSELRPAFDQLLDDMPDTLAVPSATPPTARRWPTAIAAAFVLAAGMGLGAYVTKPAPVTRGWHDYVAAYQALYVQDTLAVVEQTEAETQAQLMRVASTLGRDLNGATAVPGLDYKRAQLLGFNGKALVQMAYLSETGAPMALCIIRSATSNALTQMQLEGMEAASWSDGEYAYLLIGGDDAAKTQIAASYLQANL